MSVITCDGPDECCGRCHGVTLFGGAELCERGVFPVQRRVILPWSASQLSGGGVPGIARESVALWY